MSNKNDKYILCGVIIFGLVVTGWIVTSIHNEYTPEIIFYGVDVDPYAFVGEEFDVRFSLWNKNQKNAWEDVYVILNYNHRCIRRIDSNSNAIEVGYVPPDILMDFGVCLDVIPSCEFGQTVISMQVYGMDRNGESVKLGHSQFHMVKLYEQRSS